MSDPQMSMTSFLASLSPQQKQFVLESTQALEQRLLSAVRDASRTLSALSQELSDTTVMLNWLLDEPSSDAANGGTAE